MTTVPHIETERLLLRGWTNADLGSLVRVFGDADHAKFIGGALPELEVWRRLTGFAGHWLLNGFGPWAFEVKATGAFCGWCGMWKPVDFPEVELGYSIVPELQGNGYVREAASAARDWWFGQTGTTRLVSYIAPGNERSKHVARAIGAQREQTIELRGQLADVWRHAARTSRA